MKKCGTKTSSASPRRTLRTVPWLLAVVAGVFSAISSVGAVEIAQQPLYAGSRVPGNLALVPSVEFPTLISVANFGEYDPSRTYVGYFDAGKCYEYVFDANESERHFKPVSETANRACPGNNRWSGNFMNWAATQTIDPFRSALTGGYRVRDTSTETWLEKAVSDRDGSEGANENFPRRTIPASGVDATVVSNATPASWTKFRSRIDGHGNRMRFTHGDRASSLANNNPGMSQPVPYDPSQHPLDTSTFPSTGAPPGLDSTRRDEVVYEVSVRVAVCVPGLLEPNCTKYDGGWKPEGLIQEYSDRIRFSIFGYLNNGRDDEADGGIMRARQKFVGPDTYYPEFGPQENTHGAEWDRGTGVLDPNPDPNDAAATGSNIVDSGVINYLNKFGQMDTGRVAKSFDNVSELYYAATRYFRNLGVVLDYNELPTNATQLRQMADGFPVIDWGDDDPIRYHCQTNVILGIGDTNTWRDKNLPGSGMSNQGEGRARPPEVVADDTVDVVADLHRILAMEGDLNAESRAVGSSFSGAADHNNSGYIAALAYAARTRDIRPDLPGMQTISSYWVDVVENRDYKTRLTNQYWLMGKYGGFEVPVGFNPDFDPTVAADVPALPDSSWWSGEDVVDDGTNHYKRPSNFYVAADAARMVESLRRAFRNIVDQMIGSGGGFAANTTTLEAGAMTFQARFRVDGGSWAGELQAYQVDPVTAEMTAAWTASSMLPNWEARNIWVNNNGYTRLNGDAVLPGIDAETRDYLRGDRSNEMPDGSLRARNGVLGSIVNSQPVYVGAPNPHLFLGAAFKGAGDYQTFAADNQGRDPMVYVGANDGMLHGFNAETGEEMFAFMPMAAIEAGIGDYAQPGYAHRYFVDGDMTVADVYDGAAWRTILVGTMGRGGRAMFALDVTNPADIRFLWERSATDIPAMGNSLGTPIIAQVDDGDWQVFVGNGPNGSGGTAQLIELDVFTGAGGAINTDAGSNNGLSGVNVWSSAVGGFSDTVYAGDLSGNMWRFSRSGDGNWSSSLLFQSSHGATAQPITATPLVARRPGTAETWVLFGTGRYLNEADLADKSVQTWYGLLDTGSPISRGSLDQIEIIAESEIDGMPVRGIEESATVGSYGWYMDLLPPDGTPMGERMVVPNQFRGTTLIGTTRIPDADDVCAPSGTGFVMAINPFTGGRLSSGFFDIDGDGEFDETITVGDTEIPVSGVGMPSGPNDPTWIGDQMIVGLDDTSEETLKTNVGDPQPSRVSWRELRN